MREFLRGLGKSLRQGFTQGVRKGLENKQKYKPLTGQERGKSLLIAGQIVTVAKGFLEDNGEVERIDSKGRVLKIKFGKRLEKQDLTEGPDLVVSITDRRRGVSTYLNSESYAFYPDGTYVFLVQSRSGHGRSAQQDRIRREATEKDLTGLLSRIRNSQPRK